MKKRIDAQKNTRAYIVNSESPDRAYGYTCAQISPTVCNLQFNPQFERERQYSNEYDKLRAETYLKEAQKISETNAYLTNRLTELKTTIFELNKEIGRLKAELGKKEATKKKTNDFFTEIKVSIKAIYDEFINWLKK